MPDSRLSSDRSEPAYALPSDHPASRDVPTLIYDSKGWVLVDAYDRLSAYAVAAADQLTRQQVENEKLKADLVDAMIRLADAGSTVNGLRWAMHDADALLTPGIRAGVGEAKWRLRSALATDEENNDA